MLKTVFIEGLPGSGKTTTARNLESQLNNSAQAVKMFLEPDDINPFRLYDGTTQEVQPSFFIEEIPRQWRNFISQNSFKDGYLILEAMTIQQQVNYLLWMNKKEEITPLVLKLFDLSKDLNPSLVYLYHRDAVASFQSTMLIRGQNWVEQKVKPIVNSPFAEGKNKDYLALMNSFIFEIQEITDSLFELYPYKKLKLDISSQREHLIKEICDFVS